jgi:hypothetical protein
MDSPSSASEWQFFAFIQWYLTATIELDQQQIKSLGNTSTAGHLGNIIGRKHCIPKYIYIEQSFYYVHIGNIFGQILGKQRCFDQSHI